jgi:site-specific DNA-methyltransferase (adenine-specific)
MVPMGDWREARLKSLGKNDVVRFDSQVGSGFGKNIANWVDRDKAYPTNVLHLATECGNKNHSAAFPEALPEWFIKLFSDEGDLILDPFVGSGTTCVVALRLLRNAIGIETKAEYYKLAKSELKPEETVLLEKGKPNDQSNGHRSNGIYRRKTSKTAP